MLRDRNSFAVEFDSVAVPYTKRTLGPATGLARERHVTCFFLRVGTRTGRTTTMTATRGRIENLVTRIQDDFLRTPWLALTSATAGERFGVDETTCEAVLNALTDALVVSRSRQLLI